jgi:hypothetical protein
VWPGNVFPRQAKILDTTIVKFMANFRLPNKTNSYCSKIILTNNILTFICKKMSKAWPLLVLVSLKYCAEKRLLKTHVLFFYETYCTWRCRRDTAIRNVAGKQVLILANVTLAIMGDEVITLQKTSAKRANNVEQEEKGHVSENS